MRSGKENIVFFTVDRCFSCCKPMLSVLDAEGELIVNIKNGGVE